MGIPSVPTCGGVVNHAPTVCLSLSAVLLWYARTDLRQEPRLYRYRTLRQSRVKPHTEAGRIHPATDDGVRYIALQSTLCAFSVSPSSRENACPPNVNSPLAQAAGSEQRTAQHHSHACHQVAHLGPHCESRRDCTTCWTDSLRAWHQDDNTVHRSRCAITARAQLAVRGEPRRPLCLSRRRQNHTNRPGAGLPGHPSWIRLPERKPYVCKEMHGSWVDFYWPPMAGHRVHGKQEVGGSIAMQNHRLIVSQ